MSKIATGFKDAKVQIKYDDPFTQAEYVYSLIESEVDVWIFNNNVTVIPAKINHFRNNR